MPLVRRNRDRRWRRATEAIRGTARPCRGRTGMAFLAVDDLAVIAGQATIGIEVVADVPDVRRVVVPSAAAGSPSALPSR